MRVTDNRLETERIYLANDLSGISLRTERDAGQVEALLASVYSEHLSGSQSSLTGTTVQEFEGALQFLSNARDSVNEALNLVRQIDTTVEVEE